VLCSAFSSATFALCFVCSFLALRVLVCVINNISQRNRTIRRVDLSDNDIEILPYGFVHLDLESLELELCFDLKFPPINIADEGSKAILSFFKDLQKGSVKACHAKLMLVGHGMAGKSTLAKALNLSSAALRNLLRELQYKAGLALTCFCVYAL